MVLAASCGQEPPTSEKNFIDGPQEPVAEVDRTRVEPDRKVRPYNAASKELQTGNTKPDELIAFAKTLIGTPYLYGSTNPANGFDCSGFITYVFNHFDITVPRSSIDFTNVEREIPLDSAKPGDIVLFTGTDSTILEVGHMGILLGSGRQNEFIHSTSGKAHAVTTTPLNGYYMGRFVKVIRVFKQNDQ